MTLFQSIDHSKRFAMFVSSITCIIHTLGFKGSSVLLKDTLSHSLDLGV